MGEYEALVLMETLQDEPEADVLKFQHGPNEKYVRVVDGSARCIPVHTVEGRGDEYEVSLFTIDEWLADWNVERLPAEETPFTDDAEPGGVGE